MKIPIIDPHLHFFALQRGDYDWLKNGNAPFWPDKHLIHADFSEKDIVDFPKLDLQAYVHIEAGFDNQEPSREIEWLEENSHLPMRTIAFLDLTQASSSFNSVLHQLQKFTSFVGIRHIVDEKLLDKANSKHIIQNLNTLAEQSLVFELQAELANDNQFKVLTSLLSETTDLKMSINHAGFAPYRAPASYSTWLSNLKVLAKNPNYYLKVSGFEMIDRQYSAGDIKRVIRDCVETFTCNRVMLASNFPVLTMSSDYQSFWQTCVNISNELGLNTSDLTLHNAQRFYGFSK